PRVFGRLGASTAHALGQLLARARHLAQRQTAVPLARACRLCAGARAVSYRAHESLAAFLGTGSRTLSRLPSPRRRVARDVVSRPALGARLTMRAELELYNSRV